MDATRSYARITRADLRRLARIAQLDREDYFSRHSEWAILYRRRVLCTALCDDAALHFLNGRTGVHAFSVWSFYAEHPEAAFPYYRIGRQGFGKPKFGPDPEAPDTYVGRRVELHARSIDAKPGSDPVAALQAYLKGGASHSARELAHKAVVMIDPAPYLALEVWPTLALPASGHPAATR
ncbi:MAG TPA: hypothetical protein VMH32_23315 [Burkholderiales bacterium]|nr:hypothetical protein [Burkholderiales bacterium]